MCHGTVGMIKTNTLNMITPICIVVCNTFLSIRTVKFLNTCINELMDQLFPIRKGFDWDGI